MRLTLNYRKDRRAPEVYVHGVETPSGTYLHAQRGDRLVVKWPGHKYWSGRGEQSYAQPEFVVYQLADEPQERNEDGLREVNVVELLRFPTVHPHNQR